MSAKETELYPLPEDPNWTGVAERDLLLLLYSTARVTGVEFRGWPEIVAELFPSAHNQTLRSMK